MSSCFLTRRRRNRRGRGEEGGEGRKVEARMDLEEEEEGHVREGV